MSRSVWTIIVLLLAVWVAGLTLRLLGRVINVLLIVALILIFYNLLKSRR